MEEPRVAAAQASPQVPNPPSTGQIQPPQSPANSNALPPNSKKRPLECDPRVQNTNYFKIRAVIKGLRSCFLEVLQTPDFQNCKASHEIREQLKILIELYEHTRADIASLGKSKTSKILNGKTLQEQPQPFKSREHSRIDRVFGRPSEIKLLRPTVGLEKWLAEDGQARGTYIVGGSDFGWNFITFSGREPVYYGVTKEQFRSGSVST